MSLLLALSPLAGRQYAIGVLLALAAAVCWSLGGILVRQIESADPWAIIGYRSVSITISILLVVAWNHGGRTGQAFRATGATGLLAACALALAFVGFILSVLNTAVANTLFILAAAPFFAAVLARLVLAEPVGAATWVAIAAALIGVTVMLGDGLGTGGLFGNVMALMSAFAFAIHTVALRRSRHVDMTPTLCLGGLISAVIGLAFADTLAIGWRDLAICLVMGAVQIGLGSFCYVLASRRLPAAQLTLLALIEVVLGSLWVWLFLAEAPTGVALAGGTVVLAAAIGRALYEMRSMRRVAA